MFVYELSGCGFKSSCSHLILTSFNESKFVQSYVLIPTVNRSTRVARNTASPIDHNITNSVINAKFKTGIIKTDISNHLPIFFVFILLLIETRPGKNPHTNEITQIYSEVRN